MKSPVRTPAAPATAGVSARTHNLTEALVLSRRSGLPILLLVAPPQSRCPPAEMLACTMFAPAGLERVATCAIPTRLEVDVNDPTSEARVFVKRHAEFVLPCLFVLSADEEVLLKQESRLYPPYDVDGAPLEGDWGPLLTVGDLCDLVDRALGRQQRDDRLLAVASDDPKVLVEQARILYRRDRADAARSAARRAAAGPLDASAGTALTRLLTRLGEHELAAHVLKLLWASSGDAGRRGRWVLALHRLGEAAGPRGDAASLPDLATLRREAADAHDYVLEGLVRAEQGRRDFARGMRLVAEQQVDWFAEHPAAFAGPDCETAELLSRVAGLAKAVGRTQLAVRWTEELMRRFPDRSDVQELKHGNYDRLRTSRG
jgi:Tfp pilus assembly protein PilF